MSHLQPATNFSASSGTAGSSSDAIPKTLTSSKNESASPPPSTSAQGAAPGSPPEAVLREQPSAEAGAGAEPPLTEISSVPKTPEKKQAEGPIQSSERVSQSPQAPPSKRKRLLLKLNPLVMKTRKAFRFIKKVGGAKTTVAETKLDEATNEQDPVPSPFLPRSQSPDRGYRRPESIRAPLTPARKAFGMGTRMLRPQARPRLPNIRESRVIAEEDIFRDQRMREARAQLLRMSGMLARPLPPLPPSMPPRQIVRAPAPSHPHSPPPTGA